ncbi:hypothetical protein [uncultured Desulfobacter sp.]|uniref:hypothetical protein n=1 Tax=uncultured Desulfobacter sp. TaxID=240139 RepID=UPI002AAB5E5F|nr:hypothetical protein [uncultured Desulfobacter sp.]
MKMKKKRKIKSFFEIPGVIGMLLSSARVKIFINMPGQLSQIPGETSILAPSKQNRAPQN